MTKIAKENLEKISKDLENQALGNKVALDKLIATIPHSKEIK